MCDQVIVVGGGLSGLSAAHTVLENGGRVVLIEKMAICGGNSTKATSGINGALTAAQREKGIPDSPELFYNDTLKGGATRLDLARILTHESASAVEWLTSKFGLDLSLVSRLGGHSQPRTHRGKAKFPGMTITYALLEKYEDLCKSIPDRCRLISRARVTKLLKSKTGGSVGGVEFVTTDTKKTGQEFGSVILATGGFAADFDPKGLIKKHRPELFHLPTTNGDFATGDGLKMAEVLGANLIDMEWIQVHPTGLVHPKEPEAKVKFLAAEALRGVGGIILDKDGKRFCNELGRRDYVTGEMWKAKNGPYRLVLNSKAAKEIEWHIKHYQGRGLMFEHASGSDLAQFMGVSPDTLRSTFSEFSEAAEKQTRQPESGPYDAYPSGKTHDRSGRKFFTNVPLVMDDKYYSAIITPVLHFCMGGLEIDSSGRVMAGAAQTKKPIANLYGAGEVAGGVHGKNRLGGSSLLGCVVFGRLAGRTASKDMLEANIKLIRSKGLGSKL